MRKKARSGIAGAVALILVAVLAAIAPLPPDAVERVFSRGYYPPLQRLLTSLSNLVPVALLDVAVGLVLAVLLAAFIRVARQRGWKPAMRGTGVSLLKILAISYLLFLVVWGFHYRRVSLEQKLDFDAARVTEERSVALAAEAVRRLNALHGAAHTVPFDASRLAAAFAEAERALGATRPSVPARPKWSVLGWYFRSAAIDGMTDPIFLEVVLNPDVLPVERPAILAHEWGHIAGYAREAEANFVAWLTCLRGDPLAQYSGWLQAYILTTNELPRRARASLPGLDAGPRADLQAIAARYRRASPVVRRAATGMNDAYLKANRISEGVQNYDAVLQLMLGTTLGRDWR